MTILENYYNSYLEFCKEDSLINDIEKDRIISKEAIKTVNHLRELEIEIPSRKRNLSETEAYNLIEFIPESVITVCPSED